ncbi:SubName: Full=Uncharacterized protein {ECO:0000313/EMBL:CCA77216.1} [Serendipita indica DSM 11827]|nr:SubName: Full=Uncharacterized protein {ECO:0000313/EMBL:CCA77216.1} [Serendipita indica DSM 11827]
MPAASTSMNDLSRSGVSVLSPSQVVDSLENAVENAKISGDLKSYESFVEDVVDADIKYQIRLCPALAQKHQERAPTPNIAPDASKVTAVVQTITQTDPFLPPFNSLHIGEMRDVLEGDSVEGYNVLLNKFVLAKGHSLLVTKARPFAFPQLPFAAHIKRLDKNVRSAAADVFVDGSSTEENSEEAREAVDRLSAELAMSFMAILDECTR